MNTPQPTRWALVTGASAGIGAAFARELASRGASVILTARREDRLAALAAELLQRYHTRVECIAADLAASGAPGALCAEIQRRGIGVDILVNNAGYGLPGSFVSQPWRKHAEFVQVMLTAPCELTHLLLPGMQQRGYGRVINIASLAGLIPGSAGHTLYAASKAFLIKFSQSLALENVRHGVNVCAVCPGFTYSEFHDVTGTRQVVSKMPRWMWLGADEVARRGVDAVERGEIVYVTGRVNRAIKTLFKLLPDRFALRTIQKRSKNFRNAE
jgi:short-subunit dehydrogenase